MKPGAVDRCKRTKATTTTPMMEARVGDRTDASKGAGDTNTHQNDSDAATGLLGPKKGHSLEWPASTLRQQRPEEKKRRRLLSYMYLVIALPKE
jgi:hypothetical protein